MDITNVPPTPARFRTRLVLQLVASAAFLGWGPVSTARAPNALPVLLLILRTLVPAASIHVEAQVATGIATSVARPLPTLSLADLALLVSPWIAIGIGASGFGLGTLAATVLEWSARSRDR